MARYRVVPVTLEEANEFIREHHRHTPWPVLVSLVYIGAELREEPGRLIGVAVGGERSRRKLAT